MCKTAPSKISEVGGLHSFSVFGKAPGWVNTGFPAGFTSQAPFVSAWITLKSVLTLEYVVFSPNITWFLLSWAYLTAFPYSYSEGTWNTMGYRLLVNCTLAFAYYFFFYFGLYIANWGKRKFYPGNYPTMGNMAHNMWYWFLGVLQWTAYEIGMQKIWASNLFPTPPTMAEIRASPELIALNVGVLLLIPIWRDIHFYSAHRFLHIRPLYRLVHSLHHRNTDPEPFSGLTMHPMEHLYYYSNALFPCIYMTGLSPLVFHFLFFHLVFAPAAGHSGFEDHFGSDQYHAIHHAKFEANYGSPNSAFIDRFFGTFRETLGKSKEYTGEWKEEVKGKEKKKKKLVWSAHSYLGLWGSLAQGLYDISVFGVAVAAMYYVWVGGLDDKQSTLLGLLVSVGPVVSGVFVNNVVSRDKMNQAWPFHKEAVGFYYTVVTGGLFCVLPVYHFVKLAAQA
ncbi:hypothetical protein TL16_g00861 [Triparma laevis f. inornata]|uniref:Fatty acid hydroxylase domain-containing protein n=1 Tax=Triparma laevis f. inornata TaxID=1714386 RepID=A0A9W7DQB9_9STRA|nr:hypothetical protein TL16_g00861 [Triparma laevis f. inornata]